MLNKLKRYIKRNRESAWLLGICLDGLDDLKRNNIQWVDNGIYRGRKWFADPFILDYDEKYIYALVEEYDYKINRGRIAKITIDRYSWVITDCRILLDLSTHLSFPVIYRLDNDIYVSPENNISSEFWLYRYDKTNEKLERECKLMDGRVTDAVIIKDGISYYILTTREPTPNGYKLEIYCSDDYRGNYTPFQVMNFDENIARNAGLPFFHNDEWIRVAQESNYSYGHGLVIQKMNIDNDHFYFTEQWRLTSPHKSYHLGIHTYNQYEGIGIVDVKGYRNKIIGPLFRYINISLVKLHIKSRVRLK